MSKEFTFRNIETALEELNAKDRGRYYLCICPECQQNEAFVYKNRLNVIQCNRENQCGERMILKFEEKAKPPEEWKEKTDGFPSLKKQDQQRIDKLTTFLKHFQHHIDSPRLESYRGLSRDVTEPFLVDLQNKKMVKQMFKIAGDLFPNDYSKSNFMLKRNFVFPVYGENGKVDRILLRSEDASLEPKEIQLVVDPSKQTRDFFVDAENDSSYVTVTESIIDGASFKEVDRTLNVLALTGARKTANLCSYIETNNEKYQDKTFLIATDKDFAGAKAACKIARKLNTLNLSYKAFPFKDSVKDPNEWLNQNPEQFKAAYEDCKETGPKNPTRFLASEKLILNYQDLRIYPVQFFVEMGADGRDEVKISLPKEVTIKDEATEKAIITKFSKFKIEDYQLTITEGPEVGIRYDHSKEQLNYGGLQIDKVEVDRLPDGSQPLLFFPRDRNITNIKAPESVTEKILEQDDEQFLTSTKKPKEKESEKMA